MKHTRKKFLKFATALLCTMFVITGMGINTVMASNFRDVGPGMYWAREAIDAVSRLGIMTGNFEGNFRPNASIDKFETVRILARMSGFDPAALSPQDAAYYDSIFQLQRSVIESFSNRFELWNPNVNREIGFLLYTGVLIQSDLENFVIRQGNDERLRALSREETAVFLVRFMGRTSDALRAAEVPFNDHHLISPGARPHINFLRSLGIMNGDNVGNVSPRAATTRAAMAILVYATLNEVNSPLLGLSSPDTANEFETISGTIANTYPSFRSILTLSASPAHNNRILPIASSAIITLNGLTANFSDLARDMTFSAIIMGGEIISITAQSQNNQTGGATPSPTPTPTPAPGELRTLDGTVARVNTTNNTIGIETRMLNPRGEIITDLRDYNITGSTAITRSGAATNLANITIGDLAIAEVRGNDIISLELEERVRQVSGTLVEKNFGTNSLFPVLVVQDAAGVNHSFTADNASVINRQSTGNNISPRSLRIGDSVTISAEYGRVTQATAVGVATTRDVYIRDIFISGREQSHIVVSDTLFGSPDRLHLIIDGAIDVYSLTVGSRVRLWLDSEEVSSFNLLQAASQNNFTGHIQNITNQQITVRDASFNTRTFSFDSSTVFFNSITGQTINVNQLTTNMRVQVIASSSQNNRATSVTVLIN